MTSEGKTIVKYIDIMDELRKDLREQERLADMYRRDYIAVSKELDEWKREVEYKKCPFCGSEAEESIGEMYCTIICSNEDCIGHDITQEYGIIEHAKKAWNERIV